MDKTKIGVPLADSIIFCVAIDRYDFLKGCEMGCANLQQGRTDVADPGNNQRPVWLLFHLRRNISELIVICGFVIKLLNGNIVFGHCDMNSWQKIQTDPDVYADKLTVLD